MKKTKKKQKIYAFIDSQNLNLGVRSQGWVLDLKRFRIYLQEKYNVSKAYIFIGYVEENKNLYEFLKKAGFLLIFKPTFVYREGIKYVIKGNVDAELVLHAMIQFSNYEKAIIISGDGDFYCLVDYLNKKNKLLKLLIPNSQVYSHLLRQFAPNKIDFMNNLRGKLQYKKNERQLHKD